MSNTLTTVITLFSLVFYVQCHRNPWRSCPLARRAFLSSGTYQLGQAQWFLVVEWRKKRADVVHVDLAGQPAIVLNLLKAAEDIPTAEHDLNSDRPSHIVGLEMMSSNMFFGFTLYNDTYGGHFTPPGQSSSPTFGRSTALLLFEFLSLPHHPSQGRRDHLRALPKGHEGRAPEFWTDRGYPVSRA